MKPTPCKSLMRFGNSEMRLKSRSVYTDGGANVHVLKSKTLVKKSGKFIKDELVDFCQNGGTFVTKWKWIDSVSLIMTIFTVQLHFHINLAIKLMKGPLFYSKILLLENTELFVTLKCLSHNFIIVLERKTHHPAIASNASLKRFADYLETLQNEQPELVSI
jgi:hypothetical protein